MKTVYYSEDLKKYFENEKECALAEKEFNEKHALELKAKEEKTAAAKEVERLYKEASDKYKEANAALSDFCSKYGVYHSSITEAPSTSNLLDTFFNRFWL